MANPSLESFTEAGKAGLETLKSVINISLSGVEQLASHHLSSTRDSLLDQVESSRQLLGSKDPQQALGLLGAHLQPQAERSIAYFRRLYEISAGSHEQYVKLLEQGHAELNKSVSAILDNYAKSSGNSELAISAVKSAISAANSAFENANKAARQVADITEASVSAASKATTRAVEAANPARRKAA